MNKTKAFGSSLGVTLLRDDPSNPAKGSSARLAPTYNTGWMNSDIRRTYLSDNVVESVSGPELVTNGTFDTDSGWTKGGAAAITGGQATFSGNSAYVEQYMPSAVAGGVYKIEFDYTNIPFNNTGGLLTLNATAGYNYFSNPKWSFGGSGHAVFYVTCPVSSPYLLIGNTNFGYSTQGTIDNVTMRLVAVDRSYKAKGALIEGTLTKSAVASAAELVAYSGFSAANYLREPYSADLDFGTGEWSVGAWVNVPVSLPSASFPLVGSNLFTGQTSTREDANGSVSTWDSATRTLSLTATGSTSNNYPFVRFPLGLSSTRVYEIEAQLSASAGVDLTKVRVAVGFDNAAAAAPNSSGYVKARMIGSSLEPDKIFFRFGSLGAAPYTVTVDSLVVTEVAPALIADRAHSSGAKINLGASQVGRLTATAFDGTTTRTVTTTAAYNTATWAKAEACYTTDGTLAIRVNGVEVAATRGNPMLTLNNSSAVLTIGNSFALDAPFPGSIALLKLSATVPTPEQSVWMYEQEKQLFRANAKCCLPDAGSIVDLSYDEATDKWIAASATNISEWSGLVRTSVTATPAGSYSKLAAAGGVTLQARTTTSPGVDITIPAYGLREELVKRAEAAARLNAQLATFDYVGGFTANTTNGNTAIVSVAGLTYPTSYIGARVSGSGIPANTTIVAVSGTTIYLSAAATATATAVQVSFVDYVLPVGYEAKEVSLAGAAQREGATQQFTRLFDGFKETIRFGTAPSHTALIQIQAARSAA
jgi:hypothetical protein